MNYSARHTLLFFSLALFFYSPVALACMPPPGAELPGPQGIFDVGKSSLMGVGENAKWYFGIPLETRSLDSCGRKTLYINISVLLAPILLFIVAFHWFNLRKKRKNIEPASP